MKNSESTVGVQKSPITEEGMKIIKELGDVLRGIHERLVLEGFEIKDGCIIRKIK